MSHTRELIDEEQKLALLHFIRRRRKNPTAELRDHGIGSQKLAAWERGTRMQVGTYYRIKDILKVPDWALQAAGCSAQSLAIVHGYLRSPHLNERQAYLEDYLNLIRRLFLRILPETDIQTDKVLEARGLPYRAISRYNFTNGRWASISAEPVAGSIYLTLWYHTDKHAALDFLLAAFAGTCDIRHMLRLLSQIGRMRKGQVLRMDKLPREKFESPFYKS